MRLDTLGLIRYGHFTDKRLVLPRAPTGPDLHVIFGPNEAGKSTLFSAWLDLLFGFPMQTPYSFLHDNRALRIEAQISTTGGALHLARLKGNKNTLLDARSDQPVADTVLGAALGGLDRDSYTTMFSLDDETLEQGGESILASKGSLGELLFSASAGLAHLSDGLREVQEDAGQWFRTGARKYTLNDHKARLRELDAQRKEVDLQVSQWRKLKDAAQQAEAAYRHASAQRAATQTELTALQRDLDALRDLARLRRIEARLAELPPAQDLPEAWRSALPDWQRDEAELAALLPQAQDKQAKLDADLAALPQDTNAEALLPQLADWEHRFGAIAKESADLPRRRAALAALQQDMAALVTRLGRRLGRPGLTPEATALPPATAARLTALIEEDAVLRSTMAQAQTELARARQALPDEAATAPLDEAALSRLDPLVAELRRADLLRLSADADAALRAAQATLQQALAALAPWRGDGAQLAALDLPGADTLRALDETQRATRTAQRDAQAECDRLAAQAAQLRAGVADAARLTPEQAADLRAARDAAWQAHKAALTLASAQEFERAMQADDRIRATQIEQARLSERLAQIARTDAALEQAQAQRDTAEAAVAQMDARVAALWERLGIAPQARSLADFTDWRARRDVALGAQRAVAVAQGDKDAALARLTNAQTTLGSALSALGRDLPGADFATLLAEAEIVLQMAERLRLHAERQRDLVQREAEIAAAQQARADWQAEWDALCAACWIGLPAPDVGAMRDILRALADLAALTPQAREMTHRIASIDADIAGFDDDLCKIASQLGEAPEGGFQTLWPRLRARLERAKDHASARAGLRAALQENAAHLDALQARQGQLDHAVAALHAQFGQKPLAEIATQIAAIAQAQAAEAERAELREGLAERLDCDDLDAEIARLDALDRDAAQVQLEGLKVTLGAQQKAQEAAYADLSAAQRTRDALGHDSAPARLAAERATLIAQIEEEAQEYLARQAGILAVQQGLRHYRETHRSSMMTRAAEAFARLTGGRYKGLATQPDGKDDILIAQLADGGTKEVKTLSKGTRFQLYLALRAAGYQDFASARPSVPFIADDIMETFDDTRAEAAFGLLAQMAEGGQVIYLTHHAHLCDIARRACPTVQLHDLRDL